MSTSRQHQQEATAAGLRGQLRASAGYRRCWIAILGPGRGDLTTLAGHLSRRRKASNRNQVMAGAFTRPTRGKENPKNPGSRASPNEPCHWRRRTVSLIMMRWCKKMFARKIRLQPAVHHKIGLPTQHNVLRKHVHTMLFGESFLLLLTCTLRYRLLKSYLYDSEVYCFKSILFL